MYNRLVEFAEKTKCEIHSELLSIWIPKNHSKSHALIHSIHSTLIIKSFLLSWSTLVFVVRLFSGLRGSQWGGGFYGYRLKFWLFYGYR